MLTGVYALGCSNGSFTVNSCTLSIVGGTTVSFCGLVSSFGLL